MGRKYNPESIPQTKVNPRGNFLGKLDIEETATNDGRLAYRVKLKVTEPKHLAGRQYSKWCQIGTPKDKDARDPKTWDSSWGATDLNNAIRFAGVKQSKDLDDDIEAANDQVIGFTATVRQRKDKETGKPIEGVFDNEVTDFWKPGTREVEEFEEPGTKASSAGAGERKPKQAEVEEDEEAADEAFAKPATTKSTDSEGPAPSRTVKGKKAEMKKCPDCGELFPKSEIMDHMDSCGEGE